MSMDLLFRLITGALFVVVIATRRYYEIRATKSASEAVAQDLDFRTQIAIQSALLTVSNLAIIAYLIYPAWMAWSSLRLTTRVH